ncbi:hypothetical protein A5635_10375 [Mycobacterium asiaticum]|uniref:Uncharacterized protein n=1 Tax=Mycobacterium asiaticum TaxID=1790 RepID=A0A1A3MX36_MYCAS|nr:hypothetical protein A5635_10375 [Mycobacterium asiaticum]
MQPQPATPDCPDVVDVRCQGGLHFKIVERDTIEIKCKHCSDRDSVVLHRISLNDFSVTTLKLKELRGRGARTPRKETP